MSSGMQNAQNSAAIISSMVLEPSFVDHFFDFPEMFFSQKGALGKVGAAARGGGAPLLKAPGPKKLKNKGFGVWGVGGGLLPWVLLACLGPISLPMPFKGCLW